MIFVLFLVSGGVLGWWWHAAAETRGCVEWSTVASFFPSEESHKAPPTPLCRRQGGEESFGLMLTTRCDDGENGEKLRGLEDCDVWWRPVFDDVIPPMPELTVALTEDFGACRRHGEVGVLGLGGDAFGKCVIGNETFDGGGFDVLQARRLAAEQQSLSSKETLSKRLESLLSTFFSERDREMFERVVAETTLSEFRRDLLSLDAATLDAFLSSSRYVPHALNAKGMHVVRAMLAQNVRDARIKAYSTSAQNHILEEWTRDGILVRPFLGDDQLENLLNVVSGEPPSCGNTYEWIQRNVTSKANEDDPQFLAHVDSFATVVKVWLFQSPLDLRHGPLTFVKGSHRLDEDKLRWMYAYSQDEAALREPSFRLKGSPLAEAFAPEFVRRCQDNADPVLPPPNNRHAAHMNNLTLVIADTSAIHFRSRAHPGFVRVSYRLKGDNGGGLPRLDPFRPPLVGGDGAAAGLDAPVCLRHHETVGGGGASLS